MGVFKDLTGKKFGRLTVLQREQSFGRHIYWLCLCSCGEKTEVSSSNLCHDKIKSCGCIKKEILTKRNKQKTGIRTHNWQGVGDLSKTYWSRIIHHAKEKNRIFEIDMLECWNLFLHQNKCCALSGMPIQFAEIGNTGGKTGTASLDRINPLLGYLPNNVQWVHKDIQRLKSDLMQDKFINLCNNISLYQLKLNT